MLLIGQFDSPFVRRVAIALDLYGMAFEHAPWSGFGDVEKIAAFNPLRRVPTLVADGVVFTDSGAILEVLDDMAGPDRALIARSGPARRDTLRLTALASGAADKAVSLVYERALRDTALAMWVARCRSQVSGALDALEAERAQRTTPWLLGERIGHADIMLGCVCRFISDALPEAFDLGDWPALRVHSARCEAMAVFAERSQAFYITPPAGA